MKNLILILIIISFGCIKTDDTLVVKNDTNQPQEVRIDFQKDLNTIETNDMKAFDLSGWHHVQIGNKKDSVFISGLVVYP